MALRAFVVVIAAGLAGAGMGAVARWSSPRAPARPAGVERALRALDAWQRRGDLAALRSAAAALPAEGPLPEPWRSEADLVRVAAEDDPEALWRFATEGPRDAARARALLLLATRGPDAPARERALARLREDYPASWVHRSPGALR